jgi:hypothetical protein
MKKSFSMFITLFIIIVFSFVIILGLRISSLQLEVNKYYMPMIRMFDISNDISDVVTKILRDKKQCIDNVNIKYENFYIKSNIYFIPKCNWKEVNTTRYVLDINLEIIDYDYNVTYYKQYYKYIR